MKRTKDSYRLLATVPTRSQIWTPLEWDLTGLSADDTALCNSVDSVRSLACLGDLVSAHIQVGYSMA
jgi:hypothetical protein